MKNTLTLIIFLVAFGVTLSVNAYNEKHFSRFFIRKTCHKCDLYKANFSGADLTNADFEGSNLISANFQNATLLGVNFTDASLAGANFNGAMWIDGSMCEEGSYGRCIKKAKQ